MSTTTNRATTMKAIVQDRYGPPDVLEFRDTDRPAVGDHDVLVRVRAAAVNPADRAVTSGVPYIVRPGFGPLKPRNGVRGGRLTRRLHETASGEEGPVSDVRERGPRLPPRWFIRLAWFTHRALYRVTRGRVGLWRPRTGKWGTLRLTTVGRRTGQDRSVMIAYLVDGANLIAMAMNGWADGEPAWWLNLQAHPDARVDLADGPRTVQGRAAEGQERTRLWARWREVDPKLDAYAAMRSTETAIVILEPGPDPSTTPPERPGL